MQTSDSPMEIKRIASAYQSDALLAVSYVSGHTLGLFVACAPPIIYTLQLFHYFIILTFSLRVVTGFGQSMDMTSSRHLEYIFTVLWILSPGACYG